jgi:cytochrome c-type biogenesis protein CcmH/NrfG
MVWYFEGMTQVGALLLFVGVLAGVRTYQTWRAWDQSRESADEHAEPDTVAIDDSRVDDPDDDPTDDPDDDPTDDPDDDPTAADSPER